MIAGTEAMTATEVEAIEQALISYYGRKGTYDVAATLVNELRGVNVSPAMTAIGESLLKLIGYAGF